MSYYLKFYCIGAKEFNLYKTDFFHLNYRVSKPEQILYNSSGMISDMEDEIDIGPEVIHLYEVRPTDCNVTN